MRALLSFPTRRSSDLGLSMDIITEALEQARQGRLYILDVMDQALAAPRSDLSRHAPRIVTMQVNPDKIGEVIGPKGKTIRSIQEETGTEVTIDDSGLVTIASEIGRASCREGGSGV